MSESRRAPGSLFPVWSKLELAVTSVDNDKAETPTRHLLPLTCILRIDLVRAINSAGPVGVRIHHGRPLAGIGTKKIFAVSGPEGNANWHRALPP
jgi:hypothetical protein